MATQLPSPASAAPRAPASLWRHGDFLKLWAGQSISMVGTLVSGFALPLIAVLLLGANAAQVALLSGLGTAPRLAVGLVAGVWVDRLRRRPILIAADAGRALVLASVPAAALLHRLGMGQLYAVALLTSLLGVFFDVAYPAYLPSLVGRERLAEGNSKLEASAAVAEVAGFGLAGVLVQALTAPIAVLVDALSYVVSAVSLALIRAPEPEAWRAGRLERDGETRARAGMWAELTDGLRFVARDGVRRALVGSNGVATLFGNIIGTVILLFLVRDLHLAPVWLGFIFAAGGVSAFAGAVLALPVMRAWGHGRAMVVMLFVTCAATIAIPLAGGPLWLVVALLVGAQLTDGTRTIYLIGQQTILQSDTPDGMQGRLHATLHVVEACATAGGIALGGVLGVTIGYRGALFVACAGQMLAWAWVACSPIRKVRGMPPAGEG